jgi:hypothetical protein
LNNTQVFFLNTILVHFSWYVILYIFYFFVPVFLPFSIPGAIFSWKCSSRRD